MYCRQCGKTVVNKGKYCEFCGTPLDLDGLSPMPEISFGAEKSAANTPMPKPKNRGIGCIIKALLFLLAAVLVALLLAAALKICGG